MGDNCDICNGLFDLDGLEPITPNTGGRYICHGCLKNHAFVKKLADTMRENNRLRLALEEISNHERCGQACNFIATTALNPNKESGHE